MTTALEQVNSKSETVPAAVARLRAIYDSGRTRPLEYRQEQLAGLARLLKERESEIESAIHQDLGRPSIEIYASEIALIASELALTRKKLRSWTKPQRVPTSLAAQPGKSRILHEPLGVVLIIGPWNYPLQLVLAPLVGAIAAGNCAVVKPSEVVPTISAVLAARLPEYIDPECVQVIEGGVDLTTELLTRQFDHIFYTGNGTVGRIVMEAAAKHLTPVTLELGGKSPCLVDQQTDLDVAARRIVWAKFYNAGQTCVAPDYVLVHQAVEEGLLSRLKETVHSFFGDDPSKSPDFGRIVNDRHHRRIMKLLPGSGTIVTGGTADEDARYIAPTILRDVPERRPRHGRRDLWAYPAGNPRQRYGTGDRLRERAAQAARLISLFKRPARPGERARAHELGRRHDQSRVASPDGSLTPVRRSRRQRHGGLSRPGHVRDIQPSEVGTRKIDVVRPVVLLPAVYGFQEKTLSQGAVILVQQNGRTSTTLGAISYA